MFHSRARKMTSRTWINPILLSYCHDIDCEKQVTVKTVFSVQLVSDLLIIENRTLKARLAVNFLDTETAIENIWVVFPSYVPYGHYVPVA